MTTKNSTTSAPESRATIIIGFGKFGRDAMRHLLVSTAMRRVLAWETDSRERRLQDLSLLFVEETKEGSRISFDDSEAYESGAIEILRDLYQQIQVLDEDDSLTVVVEKEVQRLLDRSARARRPTLPLGLDVIVLASPDSSEAFGSLNLQLPKTMDRLVTHSSLKKNIGTTSSLNFVLILDFEHYWNTSDEAKELRDALANSVNLWEKRSKRGNKTFDRIYLLDAWASGYKKEKMRVEETSLFLEFLLFEGQRTEVQFLFQQQGKMYSPISFFGVRMIERSSELLSRLAGARFGYSWLEFLSIGGKGKETPQPRRLHELLSSYDPNTLDQLLHIDNLANIVNAKVSELEDAMFAISPNHTGWPDAIEDRYDDGLLDLNNLMVEKINKRLKKINQEKMSYFCKNLNAVINDDLKNNVPLQDVIDEIDAFTRRLTLSGETELTYQTEREEAFQEAKTIHDDYLSFKSGTIRTEQAKKCWLWFAMLLGFAFTPVFVELIDTIPKPDTTSLFLPELYAFLQQSYISVVAGVSLFAVSWAIGLHVLNPRIEYRIAQALATFTHPSQGRFKYFVRNNLRRGGALRNPIEVMLKRVLNDVKTSIRSEVSRELKTAQARLSERKKEIEWLRGELREFLSMQGIMPLEEGQKMTWDDQVSIGVRFQIEEEKDFTQLLESNPPKEERFLSVQRDLLPFEKWDEIYNDYFLYPLRFIDKLADLYKDKDPFLQELAQPHPGPEQKAQGEKFKNFIMRHAKEPLAFSVQEQDGLPADQC